MADFFRIGAIGTGNIFTAAHIPAYLDLHEKLRLTALFNTNVKAAEKAREEYLKKMDEAKLNVDWELKIFDDAEELVRSVDIVDNCAPSRYHAYYSEMALNAGVHVMSEKPMARNWLEAERLVAATKKSKALYQLNDDNVFIPRYQNFKNMLGSGIVGEAVNVWITRGTASSDRSEWFFDPLSGGGAILDYGSHAVAGSWFLIGLDKHPETVKSVKIYVKDRTRLVGGRLCNIETDDDAHFKVLYRNPKNGNWINVFIESTWSWPDLAENASDVRGWMLIEGDEGTITGCFDENDKEFIVVKRHVGGEKRVPIKSYQSETISFHDEIASFIRCIELGKQSILDAETCANTIKVINAAQLSELRGRVAVSMEDTEKFLRSFDEGGKDILDIGDAIATELMKPYRA